MTMLRKTHFWSLECNSLWLFLGEALELLEHWKLHREKQMAHCSMSAESTWMKQQKLLSCFCSLFDKLLTAFETDTVSSVWFWVPWVPRDRDQSLPCFCFSLIPTLPTASSCLFPPHSFPSPPWFVFLFLLSWYCAVVLHYLTSWCRTVDEWMCSLSSSLGMGHEEIKGKSRHMPTGIKGCMLEFKTCSL